MKKTKSLVKTTLRSNALFSTICALALLTFSRPIAMAIGNIPSYLLILLGIGLLLFVGFILIVSEAKTINSQMVKAIIIMDISWVIGSLVLLFLPFQWFSSTGKIVIAIIAIAVGLLAYLQNKGLKS